MHLFPLLLVGLFSGDRPVLPPADPPAQSHRIRVDHADRLVVDHFSGRSRTGQDRVPIGQLDISTLRVDPVMGVVIDCADGVRCAERESFEGNITRRSSRYVLQPPLEDPTGAHTLATMNDLLTGTASGHNGASSETIPGTIRNTHP